MILVIDALNRDRFDSVIDDMFKLRARVFHDRLGWEVSVQDGRERDMFDNLDPVYLVALDETYNVVGCNRMLQTTGPHMLTDVFQDILMGEPPLRSATVWENTRFCIDTEYLRKPGTSYSARYAACELMAGITEYAYDSGITDIINVVDPTMDRILKRYHNAPYGYLGQTVQMGKTKALAALGDITEERIARIRNFAGITGNIFGDEDEVAEALAARDAEAMMPPEMRAYCDQQIADATTDHEKDAAMRLKAALVEKLRSRADVGA